MKPNELIDIFKKSQFGKDRKIRGYWITENGIVVCIAAMSPDKPEVCLFTVNNDGQILPTNPMKSSIVLQKSMIKYD